MIDPKLNYCKCGYTWKFNKFDLLLMFLGIRNTKTCPQCQTIMTFRLIYHTAKVNTEPIRNKGEIYKNG